jgi:hypothetical protein
LSNLLATVLTALMLPTMTRKDARWIVVSM